MYPKDTRWNADGSVCEISQIRRSRYLPASFRRRKKRNLRTDDSLRGPGGAFLPLRLMYQSFYRHPPALTSRISLSGGSVSRVCNAPRKCAHFLPLCIRRNVSTLLLGPLFPRSPLPFSFPPTPDAANCAHPDEILVLSAPLPRAAARVSFSPPPSPPADPSSSKKTRSRYTAALFARARRNHGFFIFADCSCIVAELTIIRSSVISRRDKVPRKNRVFQTRRLRPKYTHKRE